MMNRRDFALLMAAGAMSSVSVRSAQAQMALPEGSVRTDLTQPLHDMSEWPAEWTGSESIVMLAYPGMTALDLVAPQYMFGSLWGATVKVAAKTLDPIVSDTRLTILPDVTFDEAAQAPDVLFVPGGVSGNRMVELLCSVRSPPCTNKDRSAKTEARQYVHRRADAHVSVHAARKNENNEPNPQQREKAQL